MSRKIGTTIMIDEQQLKTLDALSDQSGKSKSAIIREALAKFLKGSA